MDADGGLYLSGRIRRGINIAGVKVDPVEVERVVEAMPGVSACRVDAGSDGRERDAIRVRVAVRPGAELSRRQVIEECRQQLAEYKLPRVIEFVDSLPAGKIASEWLDDDRSD